MRASASAVARTRSCLTRRRLPNRRMHLDCAARDALRSMGNGLRAKWSFLDRLSNRPPTHPVVLQPPKRVEPVLRSYRLPQRGTEIIAGARKHRVQSVI